MSKNSCFSNEDFWKSGVCLLLDLSALWEEPASLFLALIPHTLADSSPLLTASCVELWPPDGSFCSVWTDFCTLAVSDYIYIYRLYLHKNSLIHPSWQLLLLLPLLYQRGNTWGSNRALGSQMLLPPLLVHALEIHVIRNSHCCYLHTWRHTLTELLVFSFHTEAERNQSFDSGCFVCVNLLNCTDLFA